MPPLRPPLKELAAGLTLPTGQRHQIVVPKLDVDVVEMEDVHFHHDSAVVLPWRYGENAETSADEDRLSGLSVVAAALRYAKANPGKKLLLAGHTDSSGKSDYNRTLSEVRAKTTRALLKGDKAEWGGLCVQHQKVEDLQETLRWVAEVHGWPCHPDAIDDTMGPKTRAARRAFRKRHNDDLGGSLSLDAEATSAMDWQAFFDLFELGLTDELGDDLTTADSIAFLDEDGDDALVVVAIRSSKPDLHAYRYIEGIPFTQQESIELFCSKCIRHFAHYNSCVRAAEVFCYRIDLDRILDIG